MSDAIKTESPIEEDFLAALQAISDGLVVFIPNASLDDLMKRATADDERQRVFMASQVPLWKYRADFVLATYYTPTSPRVICVECDGKEFHTSAEQQQRDYDRDAFLMGKSIATVRFTGGQLKRDAYACAYKAIGELGITQRGPKTVAQAVVGVIKSTHWQFERRGKP